MANYNQYYDFRAYTGVLDLNEQAQAEDFTSKQGELCCYEEVDKTISYAQLIGNLEANNISYIDKKLIGLTASFKYITEQQFSEALTLLEFEFTPSKLKSSIERLRRNSILKAFRFGSDKSSISEYMVYTLSKNGSDIAKELNIPHIFSMMSAAAYTWDIKKVLQTNELMLRFIASGLELEWTKRGSIISSKTDADAVIRPSFSVCSSGEVLMYEVVRTGDYWKQIFRDKLTRYKYLFENFEGNSWKLDTKPTLVVNGENPEHNIEIAKIADEVGIDVFFTEDKLIGSENFYNSHYSINGGMQVFFTFDRSETNAS